MKTIKNLIKENNVMVIDGDSLDKNIKDIRLVKSPILKFEIATYNKNTDSKNLEIKKHLNTYIKKNIEVLFKDFLFSATVLSLRETKEVAKKLNISIKKDIINEDLFTKNGDFLSITIDKSKFEIICQYGLKKARDKVFSSFENKKISKEDLDLFFNFEAILGGLLINFFTSKLKHIVKEIDSSTMSTMSPRVSFIKNDNKIIINGIKNALSKKVTIPISSGKTFVSLKCMGKQGDTALVPNDISCDKKDIGENISLLKEIGEVIPTKIKPIFYLNKEILNEQKK